MGEIFRRISQSESQKENQRTEDMVLSEVAGRILEDILHNQTNKLGRHFDLIFRAYSNAAGITDTAGERNPDQTSYFEILRKTPLTVLSRLYLAGWLDKDIDNHQKIINELVQEVNERIKSLGGVRLVSAIDVGRFLENMKKQEQAAE